MSAEETTRVGSYEVVARLDRRDPEAVYKVRGPRGRDLALRLYPDGETEERRRARREALEAWRGLGDGLFVGVEEVDEIDGRVYATTEFVAGASLRSVLQHRRLPLRRVLDVVEQLAEGLARAHDKGVVHGGLNSSRVLISTAADRVRLLEPGMDAAVAGGGQGQDTTVRMVARLEYMAPESVQPGYEPAPAADIYALGVLFFEMLTGKVPRGRFRLPSQESEEVPPEVDAVVLRCLRKAPADRYAGMGDLAAAIRRLRAELPGGLGDEFRHLTSSARNLVSRAGGRGAGRRWMLLAAAAVLVVLALALLVLL